MRCRDMIFNLFIPNHAVLFHHPTIINTQGMNIISFRTTALVPLCFSIGIIAVVNLLFSPAHVMFQRLFIFTLLMLSFPLIKLRSRRMLVAALPVMVVAWDVMISLYARETSNSAFSYGFAMSVLDSTPSEMMAMLRLYIHYAMGFIGLAALLLSAVWFTPGLPGNRWPRLPLYCLVLMLLINIGQAVAHSIRKNSHGSISARVINYTPVSNLKYFVQAWNDKRLIAGISGTVPDYPFHTWDTGIDTYVVVVGESARAENMHFYGYPKDTTPELDSQRLQLLSWDHAISPAPVTITAVPLALSADTVSDHNLKNYPDNIINLANRAGYDTSWFSKQGVVGDYNNAITGIAINAREKKWLQSKYDDTLLPELKQALSRGGKQLIVLHLYGNHEPECQRFPPQETRFTEREGGIDACYDNSIRYTDKLLGQMFTLLEGRRASLIYFSDHALERDPQKRVVYYHGGAKPSQHAYQVPMFIWYSKQVTKPETGSVKELYSTANNFQIIRYWLGIGLQNESLPGTIKERAVQLSGEVLVLDTTNTVYDWRQLSSLKE